ncbi:hypothetical protein D3C86_1769390 [compost metagenome]
MYLNATAAKIIITGPGMPTTFSIKPPNTKNVQITNTPAPISGKSIGESPSPLVRNKSFCSLWRIKAPSPLIAGRFNAKRAKQPEHIIATMLPTTAAGTNWAT